MSVNAYTTSSPRREAGGVKGVQIMAMLVRAQAVQAEAAQAAGRVEAKRGGLSLGEGLLAALEWLARHSSPRSGLISGDVDVSVLVVARAQPYEPRVPTTIPRGRLLDARPPAR
jgi:hypothetical protein